MIEIAFDKHINALFQGQEKPLLDVPDLCNKSFEDYINYAQSVFCNYQSDKHIIVIADKQHFNSNKLALAFFVCSCFNDNSAIECLVIKDVNYEEEFEKYKPYIAVSIGIRYALLIAQKPIDLIYKELRCLNYFDFIIEEDFVKNLIRYIPHNHVESKVETDSAHDAIVYVSLYKILALAKIEKNFEIIVHTTKNEEELNPQKLVSDILQKASKFVDI